MCPSRDSTAPDRCKYGAARAAWPPLLTQTLTHLTKDQITHSWRVVFKRSHFPGKRAGNSPAPDTQLSWRGWTPRGQMLAPICWGRFLTAFGTFRKRNVILDLLRNYSPSSPPPPLLDSPWTTLPTCEWAKEKQAKGAGYDGGRTSQSHQRRLFTSKRQHLPKPPLLTWKVATVTVSTPQGYSEDEIISGRTVDT